MPCRFSSEAAEVDNVSVHPAVDPSALDAAMDAHLGEFLFWCVEGSSRYYSEGINDEPAAVVASTANSSRTTVSGLSTRFRRGQHDRCHYYRLHERFSPMRGSFLTLFGSR